MEHEAEDRYEAVPEYEKPKVVDYGSLRELTQAANHGATLDGHFTHVHDVRVLS